MTETEPEVLPARGKTLIWIARYSQILTFLFAQAVSVVACITLFLMLSGDKPEKQADPTEVIAMVGVGFLLLMLSVIYMVLVVRLTLPKALQTYSHSGDNPILPIRTDESLSKPLESLLLAFISATHKMQALFFASATINLILIYFDESWFHLFLAFMSVFSIVWLTPTVGRLARFVQRGLDLHREPEASV